MMLLFGFVAVMSFSSCQKDEDLLIGKWKLENVSKSLATKGFGLDDYDYIHFMENGSVYLEDASFIEYDDSWSVAYGWIDDETINIYCEKYRVQNLTRNELILKEIDYDDGDTYVYSRAD